MSYHPEDEELEPALTKAFRELETVRAILMKRLHSSDWKDEHKEDLRLATSQLTELQLTLTKLT